jgi:hypothetical protein
LQLTLARLPPGAAPDRYQAGISRQPPPSFKPQCFFLLLIPRPSWGGIRVGSSRIRIALGRQCVLTCVDVCVRVCLCAFVCVCKGESCPPSPGLIMISFADPSWDDTGPRVGVDSLSAGTGTGYRYGYRYTRTTIGHRPSAHPKPPRPCQERRREGEPGNLGYAHQARPSSCVPDERFDTPFAAVLSSLLFCSAPPDPAPSPSRMRMRDNVTCASSRPSTTPCFRGDKPTASSSSIPAVLFSSFPRPR